ncbi:MAG: hypothetical protein KAT70_01775 [Thermoplasmata archaeon]|nr:hypothetical protein [Thermoplasmata archaeon]
MKGIEELEHIINEEVGPIGTFVLRRCLAGRSIETLTEGGLKALIQQVADTAVFDKHRKETFVRKILLAFNEPYE